MHTRRHHCACSLRLYKVTDSWPTPPFVCRQGSDSRLTNAVYSRRLDDSFKRSVFSFGTDSLVSRDHFATSLATIAGQIVYKMAPICRRGEFINQVLRGCEVDICVYHHHHFDNRFHGTIVCIISTTLNNSVIALLSRTRTRTHSRAHTNARAHARMHTRTHTHTHILNMEYVK